jgi:hypothetical protein
MTDWFSCNSCKRAFRLLDVANRLRLQRRMADLKQHSRSMGCRKIRAGRRTDGRPDPAKAAEAAAMPRARQSSIRTEPGRDGLGRSFRWSFNNLPSKIAPSKRTDRTRSWRIRHTDRRQGLKVIPDRHERGRIYPSALNKRSLVGIPFPPFCPS